jgi:hypothetical protein
MSILQRISSLFYLRRDIMGQISLRPELVTAGGEACGIMLDNQYVGSLTLLYREEDRIWGTVQLDEDVLDADEKEEIDVFVHRYVESMIDAVGAPECLVTATYSTYDHIISTDQLGEVEEIVEVESFDFDDDDEDMDYLGMLDDGVEYEFEDDDYYQVEEIDTEEDFQLAIVGESRNMVEYQLLNKHNDLVAEAELQLHRGDVVGDIYWNYDPSDEEIDEIAQIIVSDFDPDQVDTFTLNMYYGEEQIATLELTHEDFFDSDEVLDVSEDDDGLYVDVYADEDIQLFFDLIRDDIDSITFDIYEDEGKRNHRLGTVVLDMNNREITGLVDFVNPRDKEIREQIAYRMIEELDKETEYDTFTITMQYQDEVIDEFVFDTLEQPVYPINH